VYLHKYRHITDYVAWDDNDTGQGINQPFLLIESFLKAQEAEKAIEILSKTPFSGIFGSLRPPAKGPVNQTKSGQPSKALGAKKEANS
jgi:hypothetical protein